MSVQSLILHCHLDSALGVFYFYWYPWLQNFPSGHASRLHAPSAVDDFLMYPKSQSVELTNSIRYILYIAHSLIEDENYFCLTLQMGWQVCRSVCVCVCVCVCVVCVCVGVVWVCGRNVCGGGVCVHVCVAESNISRMILRCVVPLCLSHTARWLWCSRHSPDDSVNAQVYPVFSQATSLLISPT